MLLKPTFDKGMLRLVTFFRKENPSPMFADEYYKAINNISDEQFERAVDYLIKNHKSSFFPLPAEFLEAVVQSKVYTPPERRIEQKSEAMPQWFKDQMKELQQKWSLKK